MKTMYVEIKDKLMEKKEPVRRGGEPFQICKIAEIIKKEYDISLKSICAGASFGAFFEIPDDKIKYFNKPNIEKLLRKKDKESFNAEIMKVTGKN
ncbi:MAG: hypothetical protein KKF48_00045 [Nanoarchaeota archaeon]|nr:hypothetical protein [Nanoarchaeota archaeon]MBU1027414.1 hypothetical protein [Nanoarchaeota archaeon]